MTDARIKELREDARWMLRPSTEPICHRLNECLDEIMALKIQLDEAIKDRNDLLRVVVNVDDHLHSLSSLQREIDRIRKKLDGELPSVSDVQAVYRDAAMSSHPIPETEEVETAGKPYGYVCEYCGDQIYDSQPIVHTDSGITHHACIKPEEGK